MTSQKIENILDQLETNGWEGGRRIDCFEAIFTLAAKELLEYQDEFDTSKSDLIGIVKNLEIHEVGHRHN